MDALKDLLNTIRLTTSTYFCSTFNTRWGMDIPASEAGLFHALIAGQCTISLPGQDEHITLNSGDIVAFPTGCPHIIRSHEDQPPIPARQVVEDIAGGKNPFFDVARTTDSTDPLATLMCGAFDYDTTIDHPFIRDLPCVIHIKASTTPELDWVRALIQVVHREWQQCHPGAEVVVNRLTEVLFIQLLRFHMQRPDHADNYLHALNDPKVGKALNLIHAERGGALTVDQLAKTVALSRSAFGERFTRLVGEAPKSYLQRWRLEKAKQALREHHTSMLAIAIEAGYSSEAAFSKAFKQYTGRAPGSYRNGTSA